MTGTKKVLWVAAALMLIVGSLAGCMSNPSGNGSNSNSAATPPANSGSQEASAEVVHLKFWGAVPAESGPQEAVDNWNAANPHIQVEYTRFVNDEAGNTKLETSLLAGGEVDLFINYRMDQLSKRIDAGMVYPLDELIARDQFDISEHFGDEAIVKIDNTSYYIPAIILNDFVTLNKTYLDEANLPIPVEWTWDEYKDYAVKLSKAEGNEMRWGSFFGGLEPKIFERMAMGVKTELGADAFYKDSQTSNFDHPVFTDYLNVLNDLERELKVQPPYAEAKAAKLQGASLFLGGQAAMAWNGTAIIRNIKDLNNFPHDFVTAFAPPPKMTESSQYVGGATGYLDFVTINSRSKKIDAAWEFMKWYVTEGNEPLIAGGRVPSWKKADIDKVTSLVLGENPETLFDVESFKRVIFMETEYVQDTEFNGLAEIQKIIEEEGALVLIGEQSVEDAVVKMKQRADDILQ